MSNTPEKPTQDQTYFWIPIYDDYADGLTLCLRPTKTTPTKKEEKNDE